MSRAGVVPLVLAAGASTRMGRPKAALAFGETTALGLVVDACARAGLAAPVVVAGADPAAIRAAVAAQPHPARVVENPRWAEGRATSIQAGLAALPPEGAAFLLWPVDVVLPGPEVVAALLAARAPGALAWVPSFDGRRGHPVLFDRAVAPRFLALPPDAPARDVVRALADEGTLTHVVTTEPGVLLDMNTPEEHAARVREWAARRRG